LENFFPPFMFAQDNMYRILFVNEISGFHAGDYEDECHLGCCAT
jgi:hypothetical protein